MDDSPLMLRILAHALKEADDFELVGTATDGCHALRSVLALSPGLLVIDFHLPYLNGIQVTEYIKTLESPPVVVVITSDDSLLLKPMAQRAGADAFVLKGGDLSARLIGTLRNLFRAGGSTPKAMHHPSSPPLDQDQRTIRGREK